MQAVAMNLSDSYLKQAQNNAADNQIDKSGLSGI
jgi:hypothetical protein